MHSKREWASLSVSHSDTTPSNTPDPAPTEPVFKPTWKRWGTAGGAITLASAVAGLLLAVRGRVIRRIVLLPSSPAKKDVVVLIQTASDRGAGIEKGRRVLPNACEWGRGRGQSPIRTFPLVFLRSKAVDCDHW